MVYLGKGCAHACAAGLGRAKRDRSYEMGPRKHKQIQSSPSTAHTYLLKINGAAFSLGRCRRGLCTHMCRRVGPCKTKPVSGNWAQKTQTNTELPIHRPNMPAEDPEHRVRHRCSIWFWQMWKGAVHTHMCYRVGPCETRPVLRNVAKKTQTNVELSIHRPHMPAEDPEHQVRPRCSI